MKKRSCRMTPEERAVHEFAVKIRKMTDKQIYDFVDEIRLQNSTADLIELLETGNVGGIGPVTVKKIKELAVMEGLI